MTGPGAGASASGPAPAKRKRPPPPPPPTPAGLFAAPAWARKQDVRVANWKRLARRTACVALYDIDSRLQKMALRVLVHCWDANPAQVAAGVRPAGSLLLDLTKVQAWLVGVRAHMEELPGSVEAARISRLKAQEVDAELGTRPASGNVQQRKDVLLARRLPPLRATLDAGETLRAYCSSTPLVLTLKNVRQLVEARGTALYVSYTALSHALLHALACAAARQLSCSGEASTQRGWRLTFEDVRGWAATTLSPLLGTVLDALAAEWRSVLAAALAFEAAGRPVRQADALARVRDTQLVAFALGAALEWFVADVSLRAGHLQQAELTDRSSEVRHDDIVTVLNTPGVFPSSTFAAAMQAEARAWLQRTKEAALQKRAASARKAAAKAAAAVDEDPQPD